jgi:DNA repair protein RadA/Sms
MTKIKIKYVCNECNYVSAQWLGKCPACSEWNTFQEESKNSLTIPSLALKKVIALDEITSVDEKRHSTGLYEFDRVLGGGFVKDSLTLIGGDPGIGKSTLLLQTCGNLSKLYSREKILYISGEESESQIYLRSKRLNILKKNIFILNETSLEDILSILKEIKPTFLILDSIQTTISREVKGSAGSIAQIKETTFELMNLSKRLGITSILIGHMTKEGHLAGPKILEHMVDTVINFELDKCEGYRVLRSIKNRFGSTSEVGIFQMSKVGLEEISTIIRNENSNKFGNAWTIVLEGNRSIFIEVQSLVNENKSSYGKRICQGIDQTKVNILIAIIEKYLNISLSNFDIFINITEGISTKSSSIDLCIIASILSSYFLIPINGNKIVFGEVGLTGSIRTTLNIENRLSEISGHGFTELVSRITNKKSIYNQDLEYCEINNLSQLVENLFPQKLAV